MPARNIKVISPSELEYLNSIYTIDIDGNCIVVYCNGRITLHELDAPFNILTPTRKISFTLEAINYWKKLKDKFTLFDVQNSINLLRVIYQEVNFKTLLERLKSDIKTIKTI